MTLFWIALGIAAIWLSVGVMSWLETTSEARKIEAMARLTEAETARCRAQAAGVPVERVDGGQP